MYIQIHNNPHYMHCHVCRQDSVCMCVLLLTFPLSWSCSCCRQWIRGWPAGSFCFSSLRPVLSLCSSGSCCVASFLLLLRRQRERETVFQSGYQDISSRVMKDTFLHIAQHETKASHALSCDSWCAVDRDGVIWRSRHTWFCSHRMDRIQQFLVFDTVQFFCFYIWPTDMP